MKGVGGRDTKWDLTTFLGLDKREIYFVDRDHQILGLTCFID